MNGGSNADKTKSSNFNTVVESVLVGCLFITTNLSAKFGFAYNIEREKLGLPMIPTDWTLDAGSSADENIWYAPEWEKDYKQRLPTHISKYVNFASGKIEYETDEYSGKKDWESEGSICRETLFITYCYDVNSQCKEKETWQVIYQSQETTGFGKEFISFKEAKRILNDWGLSYP